MHPVAEMTDQPDPSDLARLRAAARGDIRAFAELAGSRLPASFRLACAILGSRSHAADAAEDAFVAAWCELPRLRDPATFPAWFRRILVNECRMQVRRASGAVRATDGEARARLRAATVAPTLDEAAVLDILEDAFERLDPDDRAMLALRHLEDRGVADIGGALHLPAGTVKWRLHEARRKLGAALESM